MSFISPAMRSRFDALPAALRDEILARDVTINSLQDFIDVLEGIVNGDAVPSSLPVRPVQI